MYQCTKYLKELENYLIIPPIDYEYIQDKPIKPIKPVALVRPFTQIELVGPFTPVAKRQKLK
jgi:hypothetical protein